MTKMLKKMTALLLAGIMTMALLTACGGGTKPFSKQVEDVMLKRMGDVYGTTFNNDSALYAKAAAALDKVTEDGKIAVKDSISMDISSGVSNAKVTMVIAGNINQITGISKGDKLIDALKVTPETLNKADNMVVDKVTLEKGVKVEAIGIAAKTKANGDTYMAIAITGSYTETN